MKIVDLYEEDKFLTNENDIIDWMYKSFVGFNPGKLTIESDGIVYNGGLQLRMSYTENELKVQFTSVNSIFNCYGAGLTSLEGCPKSIGMFFNCSSTKITSLKYCPQSVGSIFYCRNIKITDPIEYRYALYSEIGKTFISGNVEINDIINKYGGYANKKYWPHAINLLNRIKL